jgi:hypothetical protein
MIEGIGMNHDERKTFAGNFVINIKSVGGAVGHRYWVLNARDMAIGVKTLIWSANHLSRNETFSCTELHLRTYISLVMWVGGSGCS